MKYKAVLSAHIWEEAENRRIEILSMVHNDSEGLCVFDNTGNAILAQIDTPKDKDYFFMALVEAEFVEIRSWEGSEWEVDYAVKEIKSLQDIIA